MQSFRFRTCGLFRGEAAHDHIRQMDKSKVVYRFRRDDSIGAKSPSSLYIDGKLREYVLDLPHEITERLFVARRAFRINDNLPGDNPIATHWLWQRGGWILVDRLTGHISTLNFTGFDPYYSNGEWYRDYLAFCSLSEDGKKTFAMVEELGKRKPLIKQPLGEFSENSAPDSACAAPTWQRQPARVTFQSLAGQKLSFTLRGQVAGEIFPTQEEDMDDSK